ncbi:MAG: Rieske 2Fe-2S domain-containing protein [Eikenella sp.]|nr:Rieske 2Fe-2S domain-containing protein [Eikenella sp.]
MTPSPSSLPPDPAEQWKHWPRCWYVVARADRIRRGGVISGHLGGRPWVLYRSEDGVLRATDAFCPHMGAHLHNSRVAGKDLLCGLHACRVTPQTAPDPADTPPRTGCRVSARAWPCREYCGLVWLHPPAEQPLPPPFADTESDYHWQTAGPERIAADWRAMICNGYDLDHMMAVHQRQVVGEPQFDTLPDHTLKMTYRTRVLPRGGLSSWLMQKLSGGEIHLVHTCAGTAIRVESRVGPFRTTGIFALYPQNPPHTPPEIRQTLAFAAVGIPRGARFARAQLWLARRLYLAFLKKDFAVVEHMRLKLAGINDPGVRAVTAYQATLAAMETETEPTLR